MAFSLEEALISGADACRRNDSLTYIWETPIPASGTHIYLDDDEEATLPLGHANGFGHREGCRHERGEESFLVKALKQGMVSHSECLEFLCTNGPTFQVRGVDDKLEMCSVLLVMADNVKRASGLQLAAEAPAWDMLDMSLWYKSLCRLTKEMKMVQEQSPGSSIGNSGAVYVVTSSPYAAFLRALAAEVADRCGSN